jgi:uncharacterized membrane protein
MALDDALVFEALIVPHRSLSRGGVMALIGAVMVFSTAVALRFWLLGAWPVVAFSLFEVPLVVVFLTLNMRQARASELIMLNTATLTVIRTDPAGRRKQISLPTAWLHVDLDGQRGIPRVVVSSHGRRCEVGGFLNEANRMSLFEALREALYGVRNPRFDNPHVFASDPGPDQ